MCDLAASLTPYPIQRVKTSPIESTGCRHSAASVPRPSAIISSTQLPRPPPPPPLSPPPNSQDRRRLRHYLLHPTPETAAASMFPSRDFPPPIHPTRRSTRGSIHARPMASYPAKGPWAELHPSSNAGDGRGRSEERGTS
jgi:hypothetical protein